MRLAAIKGLKFPQTLKDLDYFIGATGYLRHNVPLYSVLMAPLEARKAALLKPTDMPRQVSGSYGPQQSWYFCRHKKNKPHSRQSRTR